MIMRHLDRSSLLLRSLVLWLAASTSAPAQDLRDFVNSAADRWNDAHVLGYGSMDILASFAHEWNDVTALVLDGYPRGVAADLSAFGEISPETVKERLNMLASTSNVADHFAVPAMQEQFFGIYNLAAKKGLPIATMTPEVVFQYWLASKAIADPELIEYLTTNGRRYETSEFLCFWGIWGVSCEPKQKPKPKSKPKSRYDFPPVGNLLGNIVERWNEAHAIDHESIAVLPPFVQDWNQVAFSSLGGDISEMAMSMDFSVFVMASPHRITQYLNEFATNFHIMNALDSAEISKQFGRLREHAESLGSPIAMMRPEAVLEYWLVSKMIADPQLIESDPCWLNNDDPAEQWCFWILYPCEKKPKVCE